MKERTDKGFYSNIPIIDNRTKTQLMEQMKKMSPSYAPEWRFSPDNPDLGTALALLFAHLLEGNIKRLNQVPYKSFITFLNHFNVALAPAMPALAYLTFKLAEGTPHSIFVDKGVQAAASHADEAESVLFETVQPVLLTTAKLTDVISVSPKQDRIVMIGDNGLLKEHDGRGIALFGLEGQNMQEHVLYIRHDFLFLLHGPSFIELTLLHSQHGSAADEAAGWMTDLKQVAWEYWTGEGWQSFDRAYGKGNIIRLVKLSPYAVRQVECHGDYGYFIRCRVLGNEQHKAASLLGKAQFERMLVKSEYAAASERSGLVPDRLYFNDVQLIADNSYYPFGQIFAPYGLFYIASEEAFSKRSATINIKFDAELVPHRMIPEHPKPIQWKPIMRREIVDAQDIPDMVTIATLQWEYWNGRSWAILPVTPESRTLFQTVWEGRMVFEVSYCCPDDIAKIIVNAEENYWIRARILQITNAYSSNAVYYSPHIQNLHIRYGYEKPVHSPEQLLAYNNLELLDRTHEVQAGGMPIRPFTALEGQAPAVWLGFDTPPERGPIHLYADIAASRSVGQNPPLMEWQYLRRTGSHSVWTALPVADDTNGFTKSGTIQFAGPADFARTMHYGKQCYWLRAINRDERFNAVSSAAVSPRIRELLLNTTLAVQQNTIVNEFPRQLEQQEDMSGQPNAHYVLSQTPVLREEVWVDETEALLPGELAQLQQSGLKLDIIEDSEQEAMRVWVQYTPALQWLHSAPSDRHYRIDRATGRITFGNGQSGKALPASGNDIVRVTYACGGGEKGNVPAHSIQTLQSSIAFVEKVTNHYPAAGGCDAGTLEEASERGAKRFVHRHRAVTAQDYEWLAREAHSNVAKVKCLPNVNRLLNKEAGAVSIVILPKSGMGSDVQFQEIQRAVETSLIAKASAGTAFPGKLHVIRPAILEIGVCATVWVRSMEQLVPVENELLRKLDQFLHPITGGADGKGWGIGERIHSSMFYALMKSLSAVVHIPQLALDVYKVEDGERQEWNPDRMDQLPNSVVTAGKHRLIVELHR